MFYSLSVVILFENSQEKVARLLLHSIHVSNGSCPHLGHQYTPLLEAPKPSLSISCYNTQLNAIKNLLYLSGNIVVCWGTLLRDVGSQMQCVKPHLAFEGSQTEKQWPP